MVIATGSRLGPYEILSAIGAGGMGEVYKARDTKLNRDVAIKVLPAAFAADPERIARFTREAQTLAVLNHANVAHIHGLEESGSVRALVMEFVDGEDLAHRIARQPIPIDQALKLARQITEALEAAHEQGIIHRDLKPANIMLRRDGTVKVLDFGLAKANEPAQASALASHSSDPLTNSPTLTSPALMTGAGVLLGTASYMAPEQATGRVTDRRGDIWAFGCILYEMLTGKRAFAGDTLSEVLAAILRDDPDWDRLPAELPTSVRRLLKRCLTRDPAQRLRDAADCRLEIDAAGEGDAALKDATVVNRRLRSRPWVAWAASAFGGAIIAWSAAQWLRPADRSQPTSHLEITLPAKLTTTASSALAISADGQHLAFISGGDDRHAYFRDLASSTSREIPGSNRATAVLLSPHGDALAFMGADGVLFKITLADGLVVRLAEGVDPTAGGSWGPDGQVTVTRSGTLWQIPEQGGAPRQITTFDPSRREQLHAWPSPIENGRAILFTALGVATDSVIEAVTVATGKRQIIGSGRLPFYVRSGYLIFNRDRALLAAAFDENRQQITSPAMRVLEDVGMSASSGAPLAALSETGTLAYASSESTSGQIVSVTRDGLERPLGSAGLGVVFPRVSPDGRRIVVAMNGDLWIRDLERATSTRLTTDQMMLNGYPLWTPDGSQILYRSRVGIRVADADGSGRVTAIPGTSVGDYPQAISPDGRSLLFGRVDPNVKTMNIHTLALSGPSDPHPLMTARAYEGGADLSRDGRWLTYASEESGRFEIYIRPFPSVDRKWPVSTTGGTHPMWSPTNKELFYRDGDKVMAVPVTLGSEPQLGDPHLLFDHHYSGGSVTIRNYDVTPSGQFIMVKDTLDSAVLNVVLNWSNELKAHVPTK